MIEELYKLFLEHPLVTTDSRNCPEGSIFFALKGERFDGNMFAAEVLEKGCVCAVVDNPSVVPTNATADRYFVVPDVLTSLQQLAAFHRKQFRQWERPVTVIGVTGTNGKTTTKELLNAVLSKKYNVLATEGNLNNQIGVPLTLLKVKEQHDIAIVEMGANHPMDIAELCEIVRPDYGLITNVGKAHLLGFGSLEGVIEAKTKLYDSLRLTGGKAFVDARNSYLLPKSEGLDRILYLNGEIRSCSPFLEMTVDIAGVSTEIKTNLIGNYNLINVLAAATVGHTFGVSAEEIKAAVENYQPQNMRSQLIDLGYGRQIILDAYNANPTSMMAALSSFNQNDAPHKSLILGDMRELGDESLHEHQAVLRYLLGEEITFRTVLLVGSEFVRAFDSLEDEELYTTLQSRLTIRCYNDVDALISDKTTLGYLAGTILIKGSRGVKLEKVVSCFTA